MPRSPAVSGAGGRASAIAYRSKRDPAGNASSSSASIPKVSRASPKTRAGHAVP